MGKWIIWLAVLFVALAIVGFIIDAVQWMIGVAVVVCLVVFAIQFLRGKLRT